MTDQEALELVVHCHNIVNDNTMGVIINLNYEVIAEDQISAKLANIPGESYLGRKFMTGIDWRSDIVVKILNCVSIQDKHKNGFHCVFLGNQNIG